MSNYVVIVKTRAGSTYSMIGPCDYDEAIEIGKTHIAAQFEVSMYPLTAPPE